MRRNLPQSGRAELFGCLIDIFEDFLDSKGIKPENIPNDEREGDEDEAIIYGSDYDLLADKLSQVLDFSRDLDESKSKFQIVGVQYSPDDYLTFDLLERMSEYLAPDVEEFEILSVDGNNAIATFLVSKKIMEMWDIDDVNDFRTMITKILDDTGLEKENGIYEFLGTEFYFTYA